MSDGRRLSRGDRSARALVKHAGLLPAREPFRHLHPQHHHQRPSLSAATRRGLPRRLESPAPQRGPGRPPRASTLAA